MADVKRALGGDNNLSDADLSWSDLRGADLTDADLSKANLTGADLRGANLAKADLRNAYLYQARLNGAKLTDADLRNAKLVYADLEDSDLRYADLRYADLEDATLINADLTGADLRHTKLWGTKLQKAKLNYAKLKGADLEEAILTGADLRNVDLTEAHLKNAEGIPLPISDQFPHRGETVEERLRREEEERVRGRLSKFIKKLTERVERAKPVNIRNLEVLAQEIGSLQAQPEYVEHFGKTLKKLQETIEAKYAIHGKDHRYLQKQFKMARRASQIRVASQMNLELQREIKALKRDLNR